MRNSTDESIIEVTHHRFETLQHLSEVFGGYFFDLMLAYNDLSVTSFVQQKSPLLSQGVEQIEQAVTNWTLRMAFLELHEALLALEQIDQAFREPFRKLIDMLDPVARNAVHAMLEIRAKHPKHYKLLVMLRNHVAGHYSISDKTRSRAAAVAVKSPAPSVSTGAGADVPEQLIAFRFQVADRYVEQIIFDLTATAGVELHEFVALVSDWTRAYLLGVGELCDLAISERRSVAP